MLTISISVHFVSLSLYSYTLIIIINIRYLIYIDGHCAACRYAFMMRLGSVILKVESIGVADKMWYFPLLRPWYDHIPINPDLSDLKSKIEWCINHDKECEIIAENAKKLYNKYMNENGILDYLEVFCHELSQKFEYPPKWWSRPSLPIEQPCTNAYTMSNTNSINSTSGVTNSKVSSLSECPDQFCDGHGKYCTRCEAERKNIFEIEENKKLIEVNKLKYTEGKFAMGTSSGGKQGNKAGGVGGPRVRKSLKKKAPKK